jgi:hypothetical protein
VSTMTASRPQRPAQRAEIQSRLYDRQIEHLLLPLLREYRGFLESRKAAQWLREDSPDERKALIEILIRLRDELEESAAAYDRCVTRVISADQGQLDWGAGRTGSGGEE